MAGLYSVGTNNRYAMFLGEDEETADPQDIRKLVQAEEAKKSLKPASKELKDKVQKDAEVKPIRKPAQPQKPVKNDEGEDMETVRNRRNREEKPANETRPRNGEISKPGPPRRPRTDSDRRDGDGARRDIESRPRRERRDWNETEGDGQPNRRAPGSGPTRPYRPRPDGTPTGRRKREFERKSGSDKTGVKAVDKREGAGAHNWGTHKDDIPSSANQNSDPVSGDDTDGGENKVEADNLNEKKNDAPAEIIEEVKELTLDEYKALRGKRQQPQYNIRRAGEGEDQSQWNGLVVLDKKKKSTDGTDDDDELEVIDNPQRAGRQKHIVDIDITFKEARKFGTGRPGRGGARPPPRDRDSRDDRYRDDRREANDGKPTGPRRQFNGPRDSKIGQDGKEAYAPRVDDEKAFPSLG